MRLLSQLLVILLLMALTGLSLASCGQSPKDNAAVDNIRTPTATQVEPPQLESKSAEAKAPVIVFLGDSLTAGFGLPSDAALPEQVGKRFKESGLNYQVVNAGVSGDTSANGLARYDWSVKAANPDYVIIALGANDYLLGLPAQTTLANLTAILNRAKTDKIPAILVGLQPRSTAEQGSREAEFGAIYPELANQFDVPLYPALMEDVRNNPTLLQADGLHPTAKGVEIMADRLTKFLIPATK